MHNTIQTVRMCIFQRVTQINVHSHFIHLKKLAGARTQIILLYVLDINLKEYEIMLR